MPHSADSPSRQAAKSSPAVITSHDNRWLKRFRSALAGERVTGAMVGVEGVRLVEAALGSRLLVEALLVSESGTRHLPRIASVLAATVPVLRTSDKLFAGVADTKTPQGIAALVQPPEATVEGVLPDRALLVALVGVQDPGNVGTIIRAAEAFGATGAVTCVAGSAGTADPFAPKALRASAGSALRLPIISGISPAALLNQLRASGVKIYAAVAAGIPEDFNRRKPGESFLSPVSLPWDIDWTNSSAILIGNEGAGLPEDFVLAADARVCVPQAAATAPVGIESLNAAMAASVLLYEAMRQRKKAQEKYS